MADVIVIAPGEALSIDAPYVVLGDALATLPCSDIVSVLTYNPFDRKRVMIIREAGLEADNLTSDVRYKSNYETVTLYYCVGVGLLKFLS